VHSVETETKKEEAEVSLAVLGTSAFQFYFLNSSSHNGKMIKNAAIVVGALGSAAFATQALAASDGACLQHNRLVSWRAVDQRMLEMTDLSSNKFTVRLKNRCSLVTDPTAIIIYRNWTNLSCLESGKVFTVTARGRGQVACSVASVETGAATPPTHIIKPQER
jgi:hypothetical protein